MLGYLLRLYNVSEYKPLDLLKTKPQWHFDFLYFEMTKKLQNNDVILLNFVW